MRDVVNKWLRMSPLLIALAAASGCQSGQSQARREMEQELTQRQESRSRADAAYREGVERRQKGEMVAAAEKLREAVREDDRHAPAWMALGAAEFDRGRWYEAAEAFHRAARLLPSRYEPRYNLGLVLQTAGQHAKAIAEYEAALAMAPDQVEIMENLARCYIRTNQQLERAKELVDRAAAVEQRPEWTRWLQQQSLNLSVRLERRASPEPAPNPPPLPTSPLDTTGGP